MHSDSSKVRPSAEQEAVPRSQTGRTKLNPAKLNGSTRPTDERPRVTQRQAVRTQTPRKSSQVQSKKQCQGRRLGAQSSIQPNSTVPLVQRMRGPGLRRDRQYALKALESRAKREQESVPRSQTGRTKLNRAKLNGSTRPTDERPRVTQRQAVCTQAPRKSDQARARSSTKVADWAHKAQSCQTQRFHSSNG
jgi:hypothetical protein